MVRKAPEDAKPVIFVADKVEQAAEKISTIVEQATDKVKDTVNAVVDKASEGSGSAEEAAKPKLPLRGPGSAERLREANIRVPSKLSDGRAQKGCAWASRSL